MKHGCPTDCGTCGDHEQHTCLPIVEITDHCNLECPICIVNNQYSNHMEPETFRAMIDTMVRNEGQLESIALSGGEPTSHPQHPRAASSIASRPEIGRVVIITNGLRLGRDREFAKRIKASGRLRGPPARRLHRRHPREDPRQGSVQGEGGGARRCSRSSTSPRSSSSWPRAGSNEHQIGQAVELFLEEDYILSLNFQPAAYTGFGGGAFKHDPMDRLTIPGVIQRHRGADGRQAARRATSRPCPARIPQCVSLTYLLR